MTNYIEKIELLRKEESELIADLKAQEERLTYGIKSFLNGVKDDDCLPVGLVAYSIGYDFKRFYIAFEGNGFNEIDLYIKDNKIALNYGCYGEHTSDDKIPVSVALLVAKIRKNEKSLFNLINELLPDNEKVEKLKDIRDELYRINYELERLEKERKRTDAIAKLKNNKYIAFRRGEIDDKYYRKIIKITDKTVILKRLNGWEEEKKKLDDIIRAINNGTAEPVNEIKEEQ